MEGGIFQKLKTNSYSCLHKSEVLRKIMALAAVANAGAVGTITAVLRVGCNA